MSPSSKIRLTLFFAVASAFSMAHAEGQSEDQAEDRAEDNNAAANSGKSVYKASCKSCHSGGIGGWFSGAPKTGDKEAWVPLIDKGLAALIESSLNGFGDMQPKGGCETCTEHDVTAAVEYMVGQSR